MPIRALIVAGLVALLIGAPAATAQTPTVPQDGSGLSTEPPSGLGDGGSGSGGDGSGSSGDSGSSGAGGSGSSGSGSSGSGSSSSGSGSSRSRQDDLPRTGEDVGIMLFAGLSLLLVGVGLRLRTADADLY